MIQELASGAILAVVGGFAGKMTEYYFEKKKVKEKEREIFYLFLETLENASRVVLEHYNRTKAILPSQMQIISSTFGFYDRNMEKIFGYALSNNQQREVSRWLERVYTAFSNVQAALSVIWQQQNLLPGATLSLSPLVVQAGRDLPSYIQEMKEAIDDIARIKQIVG